MRSLRLAPLAVLTAINVSIAAAESTGARYVLAPGEKAGAGSVDSLHVQLGVSGGSNVALLEFSSRSGDQFSVWIVGAALRSYLAAGPRPGRPSPGRYLVRFSSGEVLDFKDSFTGSARTPAHFGRGGLLPKCLDDTGGFAQEMHLFGRKYARRSSYRSPSRVDVPREATRVELDDDVLIGTSRSFRNARPGRIYDPDVDYDYTPFTKSDYVAMADAGINYFDRVTPRQFDWVKALPAFFVIDRIEKDGERVPFPEILYHPGFLGVEDFVDEPAYLMCQGYEHVAPGGYTLEQIARKLEDRVGLIFAEGGHSRRRTLAQRMAEASIVAPPGLDTIAEQLPIWEEHFSTGCYQLRRSGSSFIHEGRYDFPYVPGIINETYRTRIPVRPESTLLFYYAFLRGAARVCGKDWGMAIYGQADPAHSPLALRMAYERGARQLWFWTSDHSHHLPFEEQLELARGIRQHIRANPRRPRAELVRAAEVAIVLPYGFTFPVDDYQKRRIPDLWRSRAFPIVGGKMPGGVSYYAVLQAAARRMEEMIRAGREFDVVIDVPELDRAGYTDLIRVADDAAASRAEFPRWVLHKEQALMVVLLAYVLASSIVGLAARRSEQLKARLQSLGARTFGAPWRIVLPWALFLGLEHHLLTAVGLESMFIGPQRDDWLTTLYAVVVLILGAAAVAAYWQKCIPDAGPRATAAYAATVGVAFIVEYEFVLWLGRESIVS